jgi:2-keto-3-deoxy-L-rhamnonate aldolase RhmA
MGMKERAAFSKRIRSGDAAIGTLITTGSAENADVLAACGFDWLFLDCEHGAIGAAQAQLILQVVGRRIPTIIRVPENAEVSLKKTLDLGCEGVIVPMVNTADDARRAVAAAKYPPLGCRSVGIARAHGYGAEFASYVAEANTHTSVIIQIEHVRAVENVQEILQVEGIDGVFIGPYDLSGSMNRLGDVTHPDVQAAIETTRVACLEAQMPVGIFAMTTEAGVKAVQSGYAFVAVGIDTAMLANAGRAIVAEFDRIGELAGTP